MNGSFVESTRELRDTAFQFFKTSKLIADENLKRKTYHYVDLLNQGVSIDTLRNTPDFDPRAAYAAQALKISLEKDLVGLHEEQLKAMQNASRMKYLAALRLARQAQTLFGTGDYKQALNKLSELYNSYLSDGTQATIIDEDTNLENGVTVHLRYPDGTEETRSMTSEQIVNLIKSALDPENFGILEAKNYNERKNFNLWSTLAPMYAKGKNGEDYWIYRHFYPVTGETYFTVVSEDGNIIAMKEPKFQKFIAEKGIVPGEQWWKIQQKELQRKKTLAQTKESEARRIYLEEQTKGLKQKQKGKTGVYIEIGGEEYTKDRFEAAKEKWESKLGAFSPTGKVKLSYNEVKALEYLFGQNPQFLIKLQSLSNPEDRKIAIQLLSRSRLPDVFYSWLADAWNMDEKELLKWRTFYIQQNEGGKK